jgi:uncharacterized protein (UPF0332 family)
MKRHKAVLVKNSLHKSEQALKSSELNLANNLLTEAQNRAYYAVFYVVLALGYFDDFATSKHHQLMGWFNKKYIYEQKTFDPSIIRIYNRLIRNRETFDYDVSQNPTKENTVKDIEDAKLFIDIVKTYILKNLIN